MGSLLSAHQASIYIRLHSRGLSTGTLDIPLAEASRPFPERLLKRAVVSVHATKSIKTEEGVRNRSENEGIHGCQCLRTY
jgi:hypothetical protein